MRGSDMRGSTVLGFIVCKYICSLSFPVDIKLVLDCLPTHLFVRLSVCPLVYLIITSNTSQQRPREAT